jgi:hypothetical protein
VVREIFPIFGNVTAVFRRMLRRAALFLAGSAAAFRMFGCGEIDKMNLHRIAIDRAFDPEWAAEAKTGNL